MDKADKRPENPAMLEDELSQPNPIEAGIGAEPGDTQRRSELTNIHDAGSDANDTPDGLTETEEAVRHAAEDIPTGASPTGPVDDVPVFDRGALPPKV